MPCLSMRSGAGCRCTLRRADGIKRAIEASNLRETLSGDGKEQLDELLLDLFQAQDARLEAMFLAGFSLGQEFSRL